LLVLSDLSLAISSLSERANESKIPPRRVSEKCKTTKRNEREREKGKQKREKEKGDLEQTERSDFS
jgi:hypothetical protein